MEPGRIARPRRPGEPLLRIGHRGARGLAPENTMASFALAASLGADAVETDVHLSRDGELVLIHDETVDRTTDGSGAVREMTLAELRRLDAGAPFDARFSGERIPTLDELLAWARGRVGVVIEIKSGPRVHPGVAAAVAAAVRRRDAGREVVVISFDHLLLREVKAAAPQVATGILYVAALADPVGAARAALAGALHPHQAYVTPGLVREAHAAGLAVSAWNLNDAASIRAFDAMGVDSAASDFPGLFAEAAGEAAGA